MLGVLTNYKQWYFTRCNYKQEIANKLSDLEKGLCERLRNRNMFEISQEFTLLNQNKDIKTSVLGNLTKIFEWLVVAHAQVESEL